MCGRRPVGRPSTGTSCIEFSSAKVVMHIAGALGVQAAVSGRRSRVCVVGDRISHAQVSRVGLAVTDRGPCLETIGN
jgi:hypothetical protein